MRFFYLACGIACVVLGFVGIFVPFLPTTPFILLAAFFFSKGSTRLHQWLIHHPRFGQMIQDWETHRVIRPRAKLLASIMIVVGMGLSLWLTALPVIIKALMAATGVGVILLIRSYPSRPSSQA
jgi:uncharacterized protein